MTYNEALVRNALINELGAVTNLKPKAMTEKILLGIHYRKAAEDWFKTREAISKEFEQVMEAVLPLGSIASFLAVSEAENEAPKIPVAMWLQAFAEALVEE